MNAIVSAGFWCVLQVTLFAVFAAAVYGVTRLVPRSGRSGVLVGGLGMIVAITLLAASPWPRWQFDFEKTAAASAQSPVAAQPPATPATPAEPTTAAPDEAIASPFAAAVRAAAQSLASPQPVTTSPASSARWSWRRGLVLVIALGALLSIARLAHALRHCGRLRQQGRAIADERLSSLVNRYRQRLDLSSEVSLLESDEVPTPATIGWREPTVLLPAAWRRWPSEQLEAAIAHELAHIASRDYAGWLVAQLAVALHFYHPLVRWLASRLHLEQELAADSLAARVVGDRRGYLTALAGLALATDNHRLGGPIRTLIPSASLLTRRVEMLRAQTPLPSSTRTSRLRGAWLAALAAAAVAVAGFRAPATAQTAAADAQAGVLSYTDAADAPIPLSLAPADALAVITLRPASLLADESMAPLVAEFEKTGLNKNFGFSARDVTHLMIVPPGSPESGDDMRIVFQLANKEVADRAAAKIGELYPAVADDSQQQQLWSDGNRAVVRVDSRTFLFERYREFQDDPRIKKLRANDRSAKPWAEDWDALSQEQIRFAVNVERFATMMPPDARTQLANQPPMNFALPILDEVRWIVGGVEAGEALTLAAMAQCNTAEGAQSVAQVTQALMTLGGFALKQQAATMQQELNESIEADIEVIKAGAEQMVKLADGFLNDAKPIATGDRVDLSYRADLTTQQVSDTINGAVMPAVMAARQAGRRTQSMNNLKLLALAMFNYESAYGSFPPAVLFKEGSTHPYSWRVAVLPFIEEQALYEQYKFDEPWDSEANMKVMKQMPAAFRSPNDRDASRNTSYFTLTGADTAFPGTKGSRLVEIKDGTSRTIMLVEAKRETPWTKPEDIPYAADKPVPELGGWNPGIFLAAWCDGSVRVVTQDIDETVLRMLITKAGKEVQPEGAP